jgi:hypothetical protein
MKKILDFIFDPLKMLAVGGSAILIAFADVLTSVNAASSYSDLRSFGKGAVIVFVTVLAILFIRYFILPVGGAFFKWFISLVN